MSILRRFPCNTLPWKELTLVLRHQIFQNVFGPPNRDVTRSKGDPLLIDLFSSECTFVPPESSRSLLAVMNTGLRAPVSLECCGVGLNARKMEEISLSNAHTRRLVTIVPAMMDRNKVKQIPKRSCGRTPTVYAKDDRPEVASGGNMNNVFGIDVFM